MGLFVKICGCANADDVRAIAEMQPDAIGFIFWPKSPRCVRAEDVAKWTEGMPEEIVKVGVFVNQEAEEVRRTADGAGLDIIQLHGDESAVFVEEFQRPVWKAIHLDRVDMSALKSYAVDAFLVDSYSTESPGGTGSVSDWNLAADFVDGGETPVLLAGGLNPGNVRQAVAAVRPWGVDVSSGVEVSPGHKDLDKVREFINQCRAE